RGRRGCAPRGRRGRGGPGGAVSRGADGGTQPQRTALSIAARYHEGQAQGNQNRDTGASRTRRGGRWDGGRSGHGRSAVTTAGAKSRPDRGRRCRPGRGGD